MRRRTARSLVQPVGNLGPRRGDTKCFFAFADTVATRSYKTRGNGRGWLGVRFQSRPREQPSEVIVHAHLHDSTAARQQEALGVLGVNLISAAFLRRDAPAALIASLMDDLTRDQVELDMIKLSGPAFPGVDNRLMSLQLVEQGLTDAAMFTASGEVVQLSEVLYKKPILVERGSFRPATKLTLDLLNRALEQFEQEPSVRGQKPVVLAEMTLRTLVAAADIGHTDFLARADILRALGFDVLISRFEPYYELAEYLAGYTDGLIGLAVGLPTIRQVADEKYYTDLPGGVLESTGRLFKRSVKMYVYPTRDQATGQVRVLGEGPGDAAMAAPARPAPGDRPHRADSRLRRIPSIDSHARRPGPHPARRFLLGADGSGCRRGDHQIGASLRLAAHAGNVTDVS